MAVLVGEETALTRFSFIEYQALLLCLAALIAMGLGCVELLMRRFQVLPLLFPGMFSIREKHFYFYDFDIQDGNTGNRLRHQSKMLVRMTLCVVLSYLWQHCVLETSQRIGQVFPTDQCQMGMDCFASEVHFQTFVDRQHAPINCSLATTGGNSEVEDFPVRVVVSCIRFVPPSATRWLMHLAIAHSVTQLCLKCFEVLVWISGTSIGFRRCIVALFGLSVILMIGGFFSGITAEFVSSWLGFVMTLSVPVFLFTVWRTSVILEAISTEDSNRVQASIEEHLNSALSAISAFSHEREDDSDPDKDGLEVATEQPGALHRAMKKLHLSTATFQGLRRSATASTASDKDGQKSPRNVTSISSAAAFFGALGRVGRRPSEQEDRGRTAAKDPEHDGSSPAGATAGEVGRLDLSDLQLEALTATPQPSGSRRNKKELILSI